MKRWPLIRHARYLWLSFCLWRWWHTGACPVDADFKVLDDVWEGRA
jgi:hypothetical protein